MFFGNLKVGRSRIRNIMENSNEDAMTTTEQKKWAKTSELWKKIEAGWKINIAKRGKRTVHTIVSCQNCHRVCRNKC